MQRWRQISERCISKLRNVKGCQRPPEVRRQTWDRFSHRASRRNDLYRNLDFGFLVSLGLGKKKNHVVSSHHVCGNLLWLPRTNTASLIRKSLILAIQYHDLLKWFYFFWEKTPSVCTFRNSEAWLDNTELNVLNPIWQKPHKY